CRPQLAAPCSAEPPLRDALHHVLLDNLEQAVFLKDAELRYLAANGPFCAALGFGEEAVIGKTDLDLYPPARAEIYRSEDRRVLAEGKRIESEESRVVHGRTATVRIIKTPV